MMIQGLTIPSPVQMVNHALLKEKGIRLLVKREDLIHPLVSGNKWRKLKGNLSKAIQSNQSIITFGGAFSNHIHATAAACHHFNIPLTILVRGEYDPLNPTIQDVIKWGGQPMFISREEYKLKEHSAAFVKLTNAKNNYLYVPEGGSNDLAKEGLKDLALELNQENADVCMVSCGTGGTAGGILGHLNQDKQLWVFSSLKTDHLKDEIVKFSGNSDHAFKWIGHYHLGGYAKTNDAYIEFINAFYQETGIPLDPIYNGKLMYGFMDMVNKQEVDPDKTYLWIHTGGLQGINAYNYMASKKNKRLIEI